MGFSAWKDSAYEGVINLALCTVTTTVEADPDDTTDTNYFKSDYATTDEVKAAGMDTAEILIEEGAVLLKNADAVLPIASNAKVTLFGHSSTNEIVCGTGSADIDASEAPTFKEALEEVGLSVNPSLWDFYASEEILVTYETNPKKGDNSIRNGADGVTAGQFTVNGSGNALELTIQERDLLKQIKAEGFENVIVLLNSANAMECDFVDENVDFVVTVKVTNTGNVAGKEVVEVYFQSPYTDYDKENGIEKAAVELCGFAKTDKLEAGASETVTIKVPKKELRAYDANNAKTYILDAGDYYFTVGRDAHDALNNILAAKGADVTKMVAVDDGGYSATGNAAFVYTWNNPTLDTTIFAASTESGTEYAITNQLETADINKLNEAGMTDGQTITWLSRNDWAGTWPQGTYAFNLSQKLHYEITGIKKYVKEESDAEIPAMGEKGSMTIAQMVGKDYDDPAWEELLDQVTYEEMCMLIGVGYHGTYAVESVAKPVTVDENGPQGFTMKLTDVMGNSETMTAYSDENIMAATWNTEFMYKVGESIGEDGLALGMAGLYGPAMNTHRSPYAGRNFEYYSEDGFLGGQIAAAEVGGIQSKGVYVYIKHFAFNDSETNCRCYSIFSNEQAMREVYLEPFEHAIVERTMEVDGEEVVIGGAMNVMNTDALGSFVFVVAEDGTFGPVTE